MLLPARVGGAVVNETSHDLMCGHYIVLVGWLGTRLVVTDVWSLYRSSGVAGHDTSRD